MRPLALALLLSGCALPGGPSCRTECGAMLYGATDCPGLSRLEARAVEALDWYRPGLCGLSRYVSVQVWRTEDGDWRYFGRDVAGLTECNTLTMQLGTDDWRRSAYTHELVHLADCPRENPEHLGWDGGLWQAIADLDVEVE